MTARAGTATRLLDAFDQDGALVVVRHGAPLRSQYTVGVVVLSAAMLLVAAWLYASETVRAGYVLFGLLATVLVLALADRLLTIRGAALHDDVFVFDEANDRIVHNGVEFAPLTKAQQVLVRYVREGNPGERQAGDWVLLVAFEDRKLRVAEGLKVPGAEEQIRETASAIAHYAGIRVEEDERMASEYWLDK